MLNIEPFAKRRKKIRKMNVWKEESETFLANCPGNSQHLYHVRLCKIDSEVELVRVRPGLTQVPAAKQYHVNKVSISNFGKK